MAICAGCNQEIEARQIMKCYICKNEYDLTCANVSEKLYFLSFHPVNQQPREWKCPSCMCKKPRNNDDNTPVKNIHVPTTENKSENKSDDANSNITLRTKPQVSTNNTSFPGFLNDTCESTGERTMDENLFGNTILSSQVEKTDMISKISELLDAKLSNSNSKIVREIKSEIKTLLHQEIQIAVKNLKLEIFKDIDTVKLEQEESNKHIEKLTGQIRIIEEQLSTLKREIGNSVPTPSPKFETVPKCDHTKTIILYGLDQPNWEDENELFKRINYLFRDILDVNIDGYIEDLRRLGRSGSKRPVAIELISRRMAKYIIDNKRHFRVAGLSLSYQLDEESLNQRKSLIRTLCEARKEGKHAIIRNNRLLINGKPCTVPVPNIAPSTNKIPTDNNSSATNQDSHVSNFQDRNTAGVHSNNFRN